MSIVHNLKCDPKPFQDVWDGKKKAELRIDDGRGFKVGHHFKLAETTADRKELTGRTISGRFTHMINVSDWVKVDSEHPVFMISIATTEMAESFV